MNRWKAAALHLGISALVIASVLGLVLWLWYPPALLRMSQLDHLIAIIALVDVTAGPLLTLIVYKQGKPSLRFDLAVIGAIQLALLTYGLHTLAQVRPVFLVGVIDRFEIVAANEITPDDLQQAQPPYDRLSWTGPQRVGAVLPHDRALREQILDRALAGSDIHVMPRYYVPFDQVRTALSERAKPIDRLLANASSSERDAILAAMQALPQDQLHYLPLHGSRGTALMLMDAVSGEPVAPAYIDPWAIQARGADKEGH